MNIQTDFPKLWRLKQDQIAQIIARHRKGNLEMLKSLPDALTHKIENDPRWWDPDYYADRQVTDPSTVQLDRRLVEQLTEKLRSTL